jgi:hypothetical protein
VASLAGKQLSIIAQTFLDYLLAESQKIPRSFSSLVTTP